MGIETRYFYCYDLAFVTYLLLTRANALSKERKSLIWTRNKEQCAHEK